jgi:hypothetical protein
MQQNKTQVLKKASHTIRILCIYAHTVRNKYYTQQSQEKMELIIHSM